MNLFLLKGGPLLIPLFLCSLVALAFFLERVYALNKAQLKDRHLLEEFFTLLSQGDFSAAQKAIIKDHSVVSRVLLEALPFVHRDRETLENIISHAISREVRSLSKFLNTLVLIGNITPLLGLLGTVLGMIKAFMAIERLGGKVNASVLAGGIWEAMLTTAVGLAIAIPVIMAVSFLNNRIDALQAEMEDVALSFITKVEALGVKGSQKE